MNKSTTNLSRVELRDSDKGEILESFILNSDGTPYDLSGKSLVFNELIQELIQLSHLLSKVLTNR